jgi:hypothetical protein
VKSPLSGDVPLEKVASGEVGKTLLLGRLVGVLG